MSVYFITCREQGICKIGTAQNPKARRSSLQTASPAKLVLEATLPGDQELERHFHKRFAEYRLSGEWFKLNDDLETLISEAASNVVRLAEHLPQPRQPRLSDEELVERSLKVSREMLAEHERIFEKLAPTPATDAPVASRFYRPVSAGGGQFNRHYCIRAGDGRQLCADMGLSWDQADQLCDVLEAERAKQRSLALPVPNDTQEEAA